MVGVGIKPCSVDSILYLFLYLSSPSMFLCLCSSPSARVEIRWDRYLLWNLSTQISMILRKTRSVFLFWVCGKKTKIKLGWVLREIGSRWIECEIRGKYREVSGKQTSWQLYKIICVFEKREYEVMKKMYKDSLGFKSFPAAFVAPKPDIFTRHWDISRLCFWWDVGTLFIQILNPVLVFIQWLQVNEAVPKVSEFISTHCLHSVCL